MTADVLVVTNKDDLAAHLVPVELARGIYWRLVDPYGRCADSRRVLCVWRRPERPGEWGWLEEAAGLLIASALATALTQPR